MDRVIVVGAGPQGLAAAAHLLERGLVPLVLEAGATAGAAVAEWGTCVCSHPGRNSPIPLPVVCSIGLA